MSALIRELDRRSNDGISVTLSTIPTPTPGTASQTMRSLLEATFKLRAAVTRSVCASAAKAASIRAPRC